MPSKTLLRIACLAISILASAKASAEEVEITGTFQIQISCGETHHEELVMVKERGKDKFSGKTHVIKMDHETRKRFKIGESITVKGKKRKKSSKRMTKGQIRKAMVAYVKDGKGMPPHCKELQDIMSKIQINKPEKGAAGDHDHGELELKAVEDDHEVVEVHTMEHIEVTHIEAKK